MSRSWRGAGFALTLLGLAACEQSAAPPQARRAPDARDYPSASPSFVDRAPGGASRPSAQRPRGEAPIQPRERGNTPEGARFADWVLSTDPERRFVLDAFVRDERTLGVIFNATMTRAQVQQAMQSFLSSMERTFSGRPVEVIAYHESGDQLARAALDPRTGRVQTVWRH